MGSTQRNDTTLGVLLWRLAKAGDKVPELSFGQLLTLALTEGQLANLAHLADSEIGDAVDRFVLKRSGPDQG